MSFQINWPHFSTQFITEAKNQLSKALNTQRPDNIQGTITVTDLQMGSKPPDLEILEVSELLPDRFKGIFRLSYQGDALLTLNTFVQANPLFIKTKRVLQQGPKMLLAQKPLVVPMTISISSVSLRGIIVLVLDKEKGITLVFKNDPLESILVSSTFDNVPNIRALLQRQIERQVRGMFEKELPQLIHNLSLLRLQKPVPFPVMREEVERKKYVPHYKKWSGNEVDDGDGYVLYRSLSVDNVHGLHRLIDHRPLQPQDHPSKQPDYVTRVQAFLDTISVNDFSDPYDPPYTPRSLDDHTRSNPEVYDYHAIDNPFMTRSVDDTYTNQERVVLKPSDNQNTAHLSNLLQTNLTISVNTSGIGHARQRPQLVDDLKSNSSFRSTRSLRTARSTRSTDRRVYRMKIKGLSDTISILSGES